MASGQTLASTCKERGTKVIGESVLVVARARRGWGAYVDVELDISNNRDVESLVQV